MNEIFSQNETTLRLACFLGVFLLVAGVELLRPRREQRVPKSVRWTNNLAIMLLNTVAARLVAPTALVAFALAMNVEGRGLFAQLELPAWAAIALAVVLFDLLIYAQHVVFHWMPFLWRLHRVHHADPDFDVTTGVRFHPLEILISLGFKFGIVFILGPPAAGVLLFEILLNAGSLFSHGNLSLPGPLDRVLRWVLVTPDMHRVHHSVERAETDSNFGFCLSWWDRLFRTYRQAPQAGHDGMQIGIGAFTGDREQRLVELLKQPFEAVRPDRADGR
ncbi:MAG: sterol desaturase family protein [Pseudomonadota bacterium]